jgi:glycosyltransferase involved in cell wall biosynthesis
MPGDTAQPDVAVVIPALNEVQVIAETVSSVRGRFGVIILVDDGSTDGTGDAARAAGARVIRHAVNLGQGAALMTGIKAALTLPSVRYIVTFDADGQHRPEDAEALVQRVREGDIDIALGTRFAGGRVEASWLRRALLKLAVAYTKLDTGLPLTDTHNGLRAMTRAFARDLEFQDSGMGHASDILSHIADSGARWAEVPVQIRYTEYSKAKGQPMINSVNIMFDRFMR